MESRTRTYLGRIREFYSIKLIQMRTRGEGVKEFENFEDIISGSSFKANCFALLL